MRAMPLRSRLAAVAAAEAPLDRLVEQRCLVDVAEDFLDGVRGGLAIDANLLQVVQHAPAAPAANVHVGASGSQSDAPVAEAAIGGQPLDGAVDLVRRDVAACQPLADLPGGELAPRQPGQGERVGVHRSAAGHPARSLTCRSG